MAPDILGEWLREWGFNWILLKHLMNNESNESEEKIFNNRIVYMINLNEEEEYEDEEEYDDDFIFASINHFWQVLEMMTVIYEFNLFEEISVEDILKVVNSINDICIFGWLVYDEETNRVRWHMNFPLKGFYELDTEERESVFWDYINQMLGQKANFKNMIKKYIKRTDWSSIDFCR